MKKMIFKIFTLILSLATVFPVYAESAVTPAASAAISTVSDDFRAVWVSTVLNLDYPSKKGLSTSELKAEADYIINRSKDIGFNAIILQVRPASDSIYPSNIFPWSEYITGTQGAAPADGFDPLAYWIEKSHEAGLELHAWINPYRVTHSASKITSVEQLSANHPARQISHCVKTYGNALYFDPGRQEAQKLIVDGIMEIVNRYDVDGIHLDDYFYPASNFEDDDTFALYDGSLSKDDWRRENVNNLVRTLQQSIKAAKPQIRFGISPFAIWQNKDSSPLGSDTKGYEAYKSSYCDTRLWVKEGYVDYICPQIYWAIGYAVADYEKVLAWWVDVCEGTNVDLYIGHAAYKEGENTDPKWTGEIIRQLKMNENFPIIKGSVFFRAGFLNGGVGDQIKNYYKTAAPSLFNPNPIIVMDKLSISQPSSNVTVNNATGYQILGTSVPGKELYVNGQPVTNKTLEGFFSCYVPLSIGSNTFTLTQDGFEPIVRTITVNQSTGGGSTGTSPKVNISPVTNPLYATVTSEVAWVYEKNSSSGGSYWNLVKGQKDLVTARTDDGKWVKLSCGAWIETSNVSLTTENGFSTDVLSSGMFISSAGEDILKWQSPIHTATNITYSENEMTIYFGMQDSLPSIGINTDNSIISTVTSGISEGTPFYTFGLKEGVKMEGFYTDYSNGEFSIHLKKRKTLTPGDKPLTGLTFVVDAGHGADDTGAKGPMGAALAEKHLNLANSLKLGAKLEEKGATVVQVRTTDIFHTLHERTQISRRVNPDLFISIHANSMAETTDSTTIQGLSVWYRNESSLNFANSMVNQLYSANPLTTRRQLVNQSNFYVCRPSWTPSIIIETSFVNNIWDFSWLVNEACQDKLAEDIANAIVNYYK